MTTRKPLQLKHSERFVIASGEDQGKYPVEFGVTISYTTQASPSYDVYHGKWHETRNDDADVFYTHDAQEALRIYNAILLGDTR